MINRKREGFRPFRAPLPAAIYATLIYTALLLMLIAVPVAPRVAFSRDVLLAYGRSGALPPGPGLLPVGSDVPPLLGEDVGTDDFSPQGTQGTGGGKALGAAKFTAGKVTRGEAAWTWPGMRLQQGLWWGGEPDARFPRNPWAGAALIFSLAVMLVGKRPPRGPVIRDRACVVGRDDRFCGLIEDSFLGVLVHRDNKPLFANRALAHMIGYKHPEEVLAQDSVDLFPAVEDPGRSAAETAAAPGTDGTERHEVRWVRQDGAVIWLESSTQRVSWEGEPAVLHTLMDITEHKQVQETLYTHQKLLHTVIGHIPVVLFAIDKAGNFTFSDGNGLQAIGRRPGEVVGQSVQEVHGDHPDVLEAVGRALEGENVDKIVGVDDRLFDARYRPVQAEFGEVLGVIGVATDITDRAITEQALQESASRLAAIVETAVDGIVTIDDRGTVEAVNSAVTRTFGYERDELVGKNVSMLMPQPYRAAHDGYLNRYVNTGERRIIGIGREVEGLHKDGRRIPMELSVSEFRLGERRMFAGILRDASTRKAAERELQESQGRYKGLFEATFEGIIVHDQGVILAANRAFADLFHCRVEEVIGRNILDFLAPVQGETVGDSLSAQEDVRAETVGLRKEGDAVDLEIMAKDYHYQGRLVRIVAVRDISERKKVDRMKNEFVSMVSHELRTPLTSINGSLGLLMAGLGGTLGEEAQSLLTIARNNGDRLLRLINDILDVEKIESGMMVFDNRPLDLVTVVEHALEANSAYGATFGVVFRLGETVEGARVFADPDRLIQVITNLLSNAAKYSPPGGAVQVSVSRQAERLRVSVTDQGPGIPSHFRERIFGKFAQADSSDARKKGGTGLGLSIAKSIMERSGGGIDFENNPHQGATFYFELPSWTGDPSGNEGGKETDTVPKRKQRSTRKRTSPRNAHPSHRV